MSQICLMSVMFRNTSLRPAEHYSTPNHVSLDLANCGEKLHFLQERKKEEAQENDICMYKIIVELIDEGFGRIVMIMSQYQSLQKRSVLLIPINS